MHRIVEAHLASFVSSFSLQVEDQAKQFEKFATYSVLSNRFITGFDLDDVVTGDGDDGIDAVAVVINENVVNSTEEASATFSNARRNHDVNVFFIQAKRSESFDLGDFLKFKEGILRFINATNYDVPDEVQVNCKKIFDKVLINVPKLRNGRPSIVARYVCTGIYNEPDALEIALKEFEKQLIALGIFEEIDIKFLDRDDLTKLWISTYSGSSASLTTFSTAALPKISGIDEAYLAVVKASDFVSNVLTSEDGNLRTQVFEENVRSFLGLENPINKEISKTITSQTSSRFPVLNNGITIVSPDVHLQGNVLHLTNFQIVNGCQTSNVLFENRNILGEVMVNVKIVETQSEDVFSDLVKATNSQTKVENNQFLSLKPIVKKIEQYFNTFNEQENRLYFERRDRQYVGQDIPNIRIFSLQQATKCVAAMYSKRPELASRYPKLMYEELSDTIFSDDTKEIIFYAACLTMYRFSLLVSNNTIPQNLKRFKWHILPMVYTIVNGKKTDQFNSNSIEKKSNKLIEIMQKHGDKANNIFLQAANICQSLGEVTTDHLKRQSTLQEMMDKI